MACTNWKQEVERVMEVDSPITTKAEGVLKVLEEHKMLYKLKLVPSQLLVHPQNRSGGLLNVADMHAKGAAMHSIGFSFKKLSESIAFEIPISKKDLVFKANQSLSDLNSNMVARPSGTERYASISTSHTTAFLKSVQQGCRTPEEELSHNGFLNFESMCGKGGDLRKMVEEGWTWSIIPPEVEEKLSGLPGFLQQALNSHSA